MTTPTSYSPLRTILLVCLCVFALQGSGVEAKSVSFVAGPTPLLAYYGDCGGAPVCGGAHWWFIGLDSNVLASIDYGVSAYNNEFFVNENGVVSVGSTITFDGILGEISWYGTGRSMDTPYGVWRENATAPPQADIEQFYTDFSVMVGGGFPPVVHVFSIYIPLSINPPVITYTHTGSTAGLDCNSDGIAEVNPVGANCVVKSAGSILTQVNYDNTYGKFYYKYISSPLSYDYYNKVAMRKATSGNDGGYIADVTVENSDYILPIPAQTISFNFTAVATNNPPNPPTIVGPTTGDPNVLHSFTLTATDPDSDTIRYGIDWNNDNLVDQLVPSSGYVNSGTSQPASKLWLANGTYTFQARTEDSKGGTSGWTSHTITIANSCTGGILNSCVLEDRKSTLTSGTCAIITGSGSCTYTCNNGTWSLNNNSCAVPKCNDGIDNDSPLDGFRDYGVGPLNDVGCTSVIDDDESNPLTPPVLTANTYVVDPGATGKPVDLIWNTNNGNEALCTLTGGVLSTNPLDPTNTDIPTGNVNTGSTTITVSARTMYTLTCPGGTDTTTIEIIPRGLET